MLLLASLATFACSSNSAVDAGEATAVNPSKPAKKVNEIRREDEKAEREVQQNARATAAQKEQASALLERQAAEARALEAARARAMDAGHLWLRDPGEQEIDGLLQAVGANWFSVRDGSGFEYVIRIDDHTRVIGGKVSDLKQLPQGSQLQVGVVFEGKRRIGRDIEIRAPFAPDAS